LARRFEGDLDTVERAAAEALGADSLSYLPLEAMDAAFGRPRCAACFDGAYPEPVPARDRERVALGRQEDASPGGRRGARCPSFGSRDGLKG